MLVERILEDFLVENLDLIEPNLELLERQFYMIGKGKIDLLCKDKNKKIVIIEIKKYALPSSIEQLISYGKDIKEFIQQELEQE